MPTVRVTGHDASAEVRATAEQIRFCDDVTDTPGADVMDADLVILCVPVGVMGAVAGEIAADLPADALISDAGSCKAGIVAALQQALQGRTIIPEPPVVGTENRIWKRVV